MATKGVNPKRWFYDLQQALRSDPNAPVIFAGAACEQWLNGRIFSVIGNGLRGTSLTAYPEWHGRQHDCAVLRVDNSKAVTKVDWRAPLAITETKLVYMGYPVSKQAGYVARLLEQLTATSSAEQRVGFLIGVYAYWPDEWRSPPPTFGEFRRALGAALSDEVGKHRPGFQVALAKPAMETLLKEQIVPLGAARPVVGCVGQYVIMKPA